MKRILIVFSILTAVVLPVCSQDLTGIENDLSAFLGGLGDQIVSELPQNVLLAEGIGDAEIGNFPHMFFSLVSAGAVFTDGGLKTIVDRQGVYGVLNFPGIIGQALAGADQTVMDIYNLSETFFFYPNIKLLFGAGIAGGVEVIAQFSIIPQALATALVGGLTLNELTAGLKVRKVLLSDNGGFPAISLGAGYIYSNFQAGYVLSSIANVDIPPVTIDFSTANALIQTTLHSVGLELGVSKKLLIFVPYFKLSTWYQWGAFDGSLSDLNVTLSSSTSSLNPVSHIDISDIAFLIVAGLDIKLGPVNLNLGGSYNPKTNYLAAVVSLGGQW